MSEKTKKEQPKRDKVAIVGYTSSRTQAPFDDPTFEIWGLNDLYRMDDVTRWDRWFQLHTPEKINSCKGRVQWHQLLKEYEKWKCPIYMQQVLPEVPTSVAYPLQEILGTFGMYFTNSISYMIALAIYEGFKEIHVYGVDMSTSTEYGHQRPSCEFFLGWAAGRGIKLHVPPESDLCKTKFLYGYEEDKQSAWDAKLAATKEQMEIRREGAKEELERVKRVEAQYDGAITVIEDIKKWTF